MKLVAIVESSDGFYPGHMVIGQESSTGSSAYFGYRFNVTDLPEEIRDSAHWPSYFLLNTAFGYIVDETSYVESIVSKSARKVLTKQAMTETEIESCLPPQSEWERHARYSFNPDTFHSVRSPCYNCVTWAIMIGNRVVPGFLSPVRQGRISLILRQLDRKHSNQEANGG